MYRRHINSFIYFNFIPITPVYTLTIPYSANSLVPVRICRVSLERFLTSPFTPVHSPSALSTRTFSLPLIPQLPTTKSYSSYQNMGSATSTLSAEPVLAAAAVAGALGYGYVHYVRPTQPPDDAEGYADASASKAVAASLHGQKKRGRKLQLPGDATLKNLDILDAPSGVHGSRSASTSSVLGTRQRQRQQSTQPPPSQQQQLEAPAAQPQDVVPGGFDDEVSSAPDLRDTPQDQQSQPQSQQRQQQQGVSTTAAVKKPKKKKGKKAASATPSEPSSSPLATSALTERSAATGASVGKGKKASAPASAAADDAHGERWTRVETRKKKASVPRQDDAAATSGADVTTSDAGITTSVTGNSSPVTERTTEDELPSELDECVYFFFFPYFRVIVFLNTCATVLVGVPWRCLQCLCRTRRLASCLSVRRQASNPRRASHGRIMGVCRSTKTRRTRKKLVGALCEAGEVSFIPLSLS